MEKVKQIKKFLTTEETKESVSPSPTSTGALNELGRDEVLQINVKAWTTGGTGAEHFENLMKPGIQEWNQWYDPNNNNQTFIEYILPPKDLLMVRGYALRSANDCPGRDPYDWVLYGKKFHNDKEWVPIHEVTGEIWTKRHQLKLYNFGEADFFLFNSFKLQILTNRSSQTHDFENSGTQLNQFIIFYDDKQKVDDEEYNTNTSTTTTDQVHGDVRITDAAELKQYTQLERNLITTIQVSGWTLGGTGSEHFENLLKPGHEPWNKWYDPFTEKPWVQYDLNPDVYVPIRAYSLKSANDCSERDPFDWNLFGMNSNNEWILIHSAKAEVWGNRHELKCFAIQSEDQFQSFMLQIQKNKSHAQSGHKGSGTQLNELFIYI